MFDASLLDKFITLAALVFALATLVFVYRYRSSELLHWGVGLLFFAAGFWLHSFQLDFNSPVILILSKTLISAGLSLLTLCLMKLDDEPVYLTLLFLPVAIMLANQVLGVTAHIQRATGCSLILGGQFMALAMLALLTRDNPFSQQRILLLTVALIPGIVFLFRAMIYLMTPVDDYFVINNSPLQLLSLYTVLLFLPVATFSVVTLKKRLVYTGF